MNKPVVNSEIERSIITTYRKSIWRLFLRSVEEYNLIEEGDKIAVCISGGKDSMLLAKCMQELKRHGEKKFDVCFITMDPGYTREVRQQIEDNARHLEIDLIFFVASIFGYVKEQVDKQIGSPCYICARMRRGHLYAKAKELGCNKIALGHHLNDVIETTLMGMFYSSEISFMKPKLNSKNFTGVKLIRPLYKIKEKDIINWQKNAALTFIACACPLTSQHEILLTSKRQKIKNIIADLKNDNTDIEDMLFRSIHNVNLNTLVGCRIKEETKDFNQIYEEKHDE